MRNQDGGRNAKWSTEEHPNMRKGSQVMTLDSFTAPCWRLATLVNIQPAGDPQ